MSKQKHHSLRLLQALIILTVGTVLWSCQTEQPPPAQKTLADQVKVQWTWKRTRSGDVNFIYGTVQNENNRHLEQVDLEFRTQNKQGEILMTRTFAVKDLPARGQKLFSEDYPVNAQEDSGFVEIKKVIPSE